MAKGRYEISKNLNGEFTFKLLTVSGAAVAHGGSYKSLPLCKKGIASLRVNSDAPVYDLTDEFAENISPRKCPKIEISLSGGEGMGSYNFVLFAKNGGIIARGEGYGTKKRCLEAVSNLKYIAFSAETDIV